MSYYTTTVGGTTVDCQKQVRSWRLFRSLLELLIPTCNCLFIEQNKIKEIKTCSHHHNYLYCPRRSWVSSSTVVTGTIFGFRRGKANFCIQTHPKSATPLLLLELAVPTTTLAREMRSGILRIALECTTRGNINTVWTMHCNGRRVGFAVKRNPTKSDAEVLKLMESVFVGAGTLSTGKQSINCVEYCEADDEIMYLRGNFERVSRSSDSQSFHLIDDPNGNIGQDLSIFFLPPQ